ncbi:optic atrophy 3 protein homolog [Bacillus rossius redtenbacheri]|uniref:optic atrophy 3 protein homolog n=1 Tax=Bacillus rossius redtenbacheri TaxID=93214 RepID=UPI002FDE75C9
MVVGAFPIVKLGTLVLRQISKPIANIAKEKAKQSPFFRTYICMPPAQFYNWCEVKARMWVMNLGKPVNIPSLNEAMAIELGANLLGEGIIFIVAVGVMVFEYTRSSRKEAAKEKALRDELDTMSYTVQELYFQNERQDAQIRELLRAVYELQTSVVQKPWRIRSRKGDDDPDDGQPPVTGLPPPYPPTPSERSSGKSDAQFRIGASTESAGLLMQAVNYFQADVKGLR